MAERNYFGWIWNERNREAGRLGCLTGQQGDLLREDVLAQ
jgi:hypothetical protein